jgi:ABC-type transport system involved in cytochrome c biogenesis permease component
MSRTVAFLILKKVIKKKAAVCNFLWVFFFFCVVKIFPIYIGKRISYKVFDALRVRIIK